MSVYEIIAPGYDGSGDTDDRVIWIEAPDRDMVKDAVGDLVVSTLPGGRGFNPDFRLPQDRDALVATLAAFKLTA